ncbi:calcium-binding protein [Rhizobium alvei]|uniref:Calcium-binding protein n=1 Tax=Rhizobium alvei TaxID=1132659 RepID=A0ABT8YSP2_9HYPH|nr:calcium-binding protein [Rhizobium alvei]MDO6966793.1 calcium-binding protein [Rhizobium alvei]
MKMTGSNLWDSLFGTSGSDVIYGNGGNDLISGFAGGGSKADQIYGGSGNDLVSGFSINLEKPGSSASRGTRIDGGSGYDSVIIDVTSNAKTVLIGKFQAQITVKNVEDLIFDFGGLTSKQRLVGTNQSETVHLGDSSVTGMGMGGNDFLFSGSGDDTLNGGDGKDFLSGGLGHNALTGGAGSDYFMFRPTTAFEYSNITDFKPGQDKIAFIFKTDDGVIDPDRSYGNGMWELGTSIDSNGYLDDDHGRYFEMDDFKAINAVYGSGVTYERSTGSVIAHLLDDDGKVHKILIAHLDNRPNIDADDFVYMLV